MSKKGPIILVDDDHDDKDIFEHALEDLKIANPLIYFDRCQAAMEYLLTTTDQPFVIFCDVNMPAYNGIEFKQDIDSNPVLRQKSIPFVFYSTAVNQDTVTKAYTEMTVQGFFQKPHSVEEIKYTIGLILKYWKLCRHPNS